MAARHGAKRAESAGETPSPDFGERYRRYYPQVFAYVYGRIQDVQATEDLVSEVFQKAFAGAHTLRQEEAFGTWLFTIARNVLISHWRHQRHRGRRADYRELSSLAADGAVENDLIRRQQVARIMEHLRRLSLREQDIIALKFDAALTNAQIAEVVGLSESHVRVILHRTLRKVQKGLRQEA